MFEYEWPHRSRSKVAQDVKAAKINLSEKALFQRQVKLYCEFWYEHLNAVDNINRCPKMKEAKNNIGMKGGEKKVTEPVTRKDVLLMGFFYIAEYLVDPDPSIELMLTAIKGKESEMELKMDGVMKKVNSRLDDIITYPGKYDDINRWKALRNCLDMILNLFSFSAVYLPNPFDKFICLCLIADDSIDLEEQIFADADRPLFILLSDVKHSEDDE